ncbi:hypothetical protein L0128_16155, partial [candidate division KSB1 bacterium]|nr:hypothetical protein [candidate division KSB1 bacterium]
MPDRTPPQVLFFKTESKGHPLGYSYVTFAEANYTIQPDDFFEYDIFIDLTSPLSQAGIDLQLQSGRCLRDAGIHDQNGMAAHPMINLFDARDVWYHRKMALTKLIGETILSAEVAVVAPIRGTYLACFRNVVITRNGQMVHTFYHQGAPAVVQSKMQLEFHQDVVRAIHWEDFRKVEIEYIDPSRLSPEIQLAENLLSLHPEEQSKWRPLLETAKGVLAIEAYLQADDAGFKKSLAEIGKLLAPILSLVRSFTIHFAGHAHIDMNWLWVWDETVAVCQRDFMTMTQLMEKYPFFKFSQSQVSVYKAVLKTRPDLFERMRDFVNRGQWEITAAMWVEGDENMASGEALVRQFLLANRFLAHHFGKTSVVCWQPDLFGHVWTMPQILKRCGIKYYYFMRCGKDNPQVFWWEGVDGSRILAATTPSYNGAIGSDVVNYGNELYRKQGIKDYLHLYGVGDHGGGPTMRDIERGVELGKNPQLPVVKFNTVENYFNTIAAKYPDLPIIRDELQFIFEGCYTTHADIKLRNRQCENLFPVLETFSVMAMPFELPYPAFVLDEGWERTCFNQFHDILPGSAIHATYQEATPITDGMIAAGKQALGKSLLTLAEQIDTQALTDQPLIVFNPSNWTRADVVSLDLPLFQGEYAELCDENGQRIPCQITHRSATHASVIFVAAEVPAMGHKTLTWRKVQSAPTVQTQLSISADYLIENAFYQLQIDPKTGNIQRLVNKQTGQDILEPGKPGNVFQLLHETSGEMSAWQIGKIDATEDLTQPARIEILEHGPVRVLVQIVYHRRQSTFIQQLAVYHHLARLDFPCTVDWQEIGTRATGSQFLKVAFPLNLQPRAQATFEIPFGTMVREANGHEYPSQKWFDVSDQTRGVSLLNDCKYGCDVNQNVMRLS